MHIMIHIIAAFIEGAYSLFDHNLTNITGHYSRPLLHCIWPLIELLPPHLRTNLWTTRWWILHLIQHNIPLHFHLCTNIWATTTPSWWASTTTSIGNKILVEGNWFNPSLEHNTSVPPPQLTTMSTPHHYNLLLLGIRLEDMRC